MKSLGDYNLLDKLGEGTLGEVFLAEHRFLKKKQVIKILPQEFSQKPGFLENFEKEIAFLALLDHPSISKVHNISCTEEVYFLVMDAVLDEKGRSYNLERYLEKKGKILTEVEVEVILRQVASALDYVHKTQVLKAPLFHGGLKLSNILLEETENGLKVFVTDFGLGRIVSEKGATRRLCDRFLKGLSKESQDVEPGLFFKNFAFLAPEQRRGRTSNPRSDVFAFGVLAYYLIAREMPEGYFDLPSKIAPEYKLNWDYLICKCLEKNYENRPLWLTDALNLYLSKNVKDINSLEVLSWDEVGKRVENVMQMSFEFTSDDPKTEFLNAVADTKESEPRPVINPPQIERPHYDPDPGVIFQKELMVSQYKPQKVEVRDVEPLLTEMVIIPAGSYMRGAQNGSRDEVPRHSVTLNSFAIDIHPVTNEQFVRFLEVMGGEKDGNNNDIIRLKDSRIKRSCGKIMIESGYAKHPVVGITWYGAYAYSKWIGKRLPTEVEWEVAAMGPEATLYPSGNDIDHKLANFFSSDTTPVMSFPSSAYGIYDMSGNVYEWCQDWYSYNYYETSIQEPDNPKGPPQGVYRVLRGGCWKSLKEDLRCAHRHRNNPGTFNKTYGFRCAADVL